MRTWILVISLSLMLGSLTGCTTTFFANPTPIPTASLSPTFTLTPAPTRTSLPFPTPTIPPTSTPTATALPGSTPTLQPSPTSVKLAGIRPTSTPRPSGLIVELDPPKVAQGRTLVIRVKGVELAELTGTVADRKLTFARDEQGFWALAGFSVLAKPGSYPLVITGKRGGQPMRETVQVPVVEAGYPMENLDLSPEVSRLLDPKLIAAEREKLMAIFTTISPNKLWSGPFQQPLNTKITSDFGTRRSYNGGPVNSYHEGTDFRGAIGTPILAPAPGRVALAETLTVRGNAVVLDHGLGVYSGLYHMSELKVKEGQMVKTGDVVGLVGDTGLVTGAHLHWDVRIDGLNVDPLEWTQRSIP